MGFKGKKYWIQSYQMSLSALLTSCYLIKAFDFLVISLHLQKLNDSQQDNVQTLDKVQW